MDLLDPTVDPLLEFFLDLFLSLFVISSMLLASAAIAIALYKTGRLLLESLQELRGKIRARR